MRSLDDVVFGRVRWLEGVWVTQQKWKVCGKLLRVEIEKDPWSEEPPDEKQREAFNDFITHYTPQLEAQIETALAAHYEMSAHR